MFGLKVIALLALAFIVSATDLDKGLSIMACAKRAISGGAPEIGVPSHDPFVVIKHNFSWHGNIGPMLNTTLQFHNMTWAGLATWNLTASQKSKDSDKSAVFDFELYWKRMALAGEYHSQEDSFIIHTEQQGDFTLVWKESTWKGTINLTKPNELNNGTVNSVKIDWGVGDIDVAINGLGILDSPTAALVATTFKTAFNTHMIGNAIGDFIKMRLSTIWWDTGKVWDLVQWCKDHPATSF